LPKGNDPAGGDQQKYDEKKPIDPGADELWRLGDPFPVEKVPAARGAVIPTVFLFARHIPRPKNSVAVYSTPLLRARKKATAEAG
jgi:hypothetical protein